MADRLFPHHVFLLVGRGIAVAVLIATGLLAQSPAGPEPPASLSWQARIAPPDEPGEQMIISGQVFDPSGREGVPGVVVYAYHTDIKGLYTPSGQPRPPRLQGWARTDETGRYELRTIRPAPYPGGGVPGHVHFSISGAGYPRQEAEELRFEGDRYLSAESVDSSRRLGRFGGVRPLTRGADGVWRCTFDIRLKPMTQSSADPRSPTDDLESRRDCRVGPREGCLQPGEARRGLSRSGNGVRRSAFHYVS